MLVLVWLVWYIFGGMVWVEEVVFCGVLVIIGVWVFGWLGGWIL